MEHARLMTTIDKKYYIFLERESKAAQVTKRSILEKAMDLYIREQRKKELEEAYIAMSGDMEYMNEQQELAELGMNVYLDDLLNHEHD